MILNEIQISPHDWRGEGNASCCLPLEDDHDPFALRVVKVVRPGVEDSCRTSHLGHCMERGARLSCYRFRYQSRSSGACDEKDSFHHFVGTLRQVVVTHPHCAVRIVKAPMI